ncbi:hypothetical protein D3C87_302840 [compost metagenome]|jgi:hypothetical protein|uniref:hypothetical protein n=1 Tax=Achromobacter sp. Root83 TaxID=1736602 RepID=UPI000B0E7964|nr:hypothetical protein [Achromobacter sp. Root83]
MNTTRSLVLVALLSGLSHAAIAAPNLAAKQTGKILFQGAIVEGATCQPQALRQGMVQRAVATCSAARAAQRAPGESIGAEVGVQMQELVSSDGQRRQLLTLTYR